RLREGGVKVLTRHRWLGWSGTNALRFATPAGEKIVDAGVTVLALGGASWPRLGSNAAWLSLLEQRGVPIEALRPANCGFDVAWSEFLRTRHAGAPVKSVVMSFDDGTTPVSRAGEFVITAHGIEGTLVYALSAPLRDAIERDGSVAVHLDLAPG